MGDHILAIDVGTQSVRALLFDPQGHLVHKVRVPIEPYVSPQPGWAEQDPDYFWENLCAACRRLWQEAPVPKDAVAGVALTDPAGDHGQRGPGAAAPCARPSSGWTRAVRRDRSPSADSGAWPSAWSA
jgi:hypothetical protein